VITAWAYQVVKTTLSDADNQPESLTRQEELFYYKFHVTSIVTSVVTAVVSQIQNGVVQERFRISIPVVGSTAVSVEWSIDNKKNM
jgi:hypothetical protein